MSRFLAAVQKGESWDLTGFTWYLSRKGEERLRLHIHTAPGWAAALQNRLAARGIRCRVQGLSEVRVDEAAAIAVAVAHLAPGTPLAEEVAGWAAVAGPRAPYSALSGADHRTRRHAVERVWRLAPARK